MPKFGAIAQDLFPVLHAKSQKCNLMYDLQTHHLSPKKTVKLKNIPSLSKFHSKEKSNRYKLIKYLGTDSIVPLKPGNTVYIKGISIEHCSLRFACI